jgi:hypothetical protein
MNFLESGSQGLFTITPMIVTLWSFNIAILKGALHIAV